MSGVGYRKMYEKIFKVIGERTPLKADCGKLCGAACCKGDSSTGMRLFPFEETELSLTELENGERLAVCNGSCDRQKRPLACRMFPLFPTIDHRGRIFVEPDIRAKRLCPLVEHIDEVKYDKAFLRRVKKVGEVLAKDESCREFLRKSTEEIDMYAAFLLEE